MELNKKTVNPYHVTESTKWILLFFSLILIGALWYLIQITYSQSTTETTVVTKKTTTTAKTTTKDETSACAKATSSQKAYESATYGYCFNYPSQWILTDGGTEAGITSVWWVRITDKVVPNSDYPGQIRLDVFKTVKDLDSQNTGANSLKNYLDKYAALATPVYKNIKTGTVGGKGGYIAEMAQDELGGGTYYFTTLDNGTIIQLLIFTKSADTDSLLSSLKITK